MDDFALLIPDGLCLVHVEPSDLHSKARALRLHTVPDGNRDDTHRVFCLSSLQCQPTVLTVEASLLSLAPLVGRPASLEFLGCLRSAGALLLFALTIAGTLAAAGTSLKELGVRYVT